MPNILDNIQAVLVLYKCKLEESETFISISNALKLNNQKLDLYVYDNSPNFHYNEELVKDYPGKITYVHDSSNPGVSKAYNEGAKFAKSIAKEWVILFDQDTVFNNEYFILVSSAIQKHYRLIAPKLIAQNGNIISPCNIKHGIGRSIKDISNGEIEFNDLSILNSGIVIKLDLFFEAGMYNEVISLDFSDHFFIDNVKNIINRFYVIDNFVDQNLSAFENDKESSLIRFRFYCIGAINYKNSFVMKTVMILRALKLSLKYNDLAFIKTVIKFI